MHCKSSVAVAMLRGLFANPGRGKSAIGRRYPRTSEREQAKRTQCVLYWRSDCNCEIAIAL
jgi:hypothetical protein